MINEVIFQEILVEYVDKGLVIVLRERGIAMAAFYDFVRGNPSRAELYSQAQDHRAEAFSEQLVDIADNDYDYQRARNRIEVRKWLASKMKPGKFGDRIVHEHEGYIDVRSLLSESRARIASPIEVIENTPVDPALQSALEELLS